MPVLSSAAGARPPSLLVHASAFFGLIFGISGTIARVVTVQVEQPSTGLRAIMHHMHLQLRMVGSKHGRGPLLKLECVATHWALPQTLISAHRDFVRSVLGTLATIKVLDLRSTQSMTNTGACPTNMEQQSHRVLAANATELTKIFQVFVKTLQGKSITVNNVTGLTSVEDLKLKVKEKTEMPGVWPELKYQSEWLHDGKTLSAYGIDQGATLEMTWLLLGGGPTRALVPDTGVAVSYTTATNIFLQLAENNAAEVGPRSRSVSPSINALDHNANKKEDAAREPRAEVVNECAAQQQDATNSRTITESSGHALSHIMDACIVQSLEGSDKYAADALPHNMEALNVAGEAPLLDSAAVDGANAVEASLDSESAGVLTIFLACCACPPLRSRTQAQRSQVRQPHFFLRREGSRHSALGSEFY